jgi:hypothetical protein
LSPASSSSSVRRWFIVGIILGVLLVGSFAAGSAILGTLILDRRERDGVQKLLLQ